MILNEQNPINMPNVKAFEDIWLDGNKYSLLLFYERTNERIWIKFAKPIDRFTMYVC